jgi:hypothetical protein
MDYMDQGIKFWEVVNKKPELVMFLVPMALLGFALYVLLQAIQKK